MWRFLKFLSIGLTGVHNPFDPVSQLSLGVKLTPTTNYFIHYHKSQSSPSLPRWTLSGLAHSLIGYIFPPSHLLEVTSSLGFPDSQRED